MDLFVFLKESNFIIKYDNGSGRKLGLVRRELLLGFVENAEVVIREKGMAREIAIPKYGIEKRRMTLGGKMEKRCKNESIYQKDLRNLIDYRREENGERLWHIGKGVMALSGIDRISTGYHTVDKLVIDRILRRVGIDPAEIEMIIFKQDAERFQKRSYIYEIYNKRQYEKLEQLLQEYETETKSLHVIHHQFVKKMRAWMMIQKEENINFIIPILKAAIAHTVVDFGKCPLKKMSLAPEEMELMILLASCYRRRNELTRAKLLLEEIFDYSRKRKMSSKLRGNYIPFACLELSKVYEAKHQYEDARYYALTGINILCCNAELQYLVALQEQYLKIETILGKMGKRSSFRKKQIERIEEENEIFLEIYKESNMDPYRLYPTEEYRNCYIFNELIEEYRKFYKMERKEFSADICTLNAFINIEKGESTPKRTFKKWMEKIGWPQTYYLTQLHGGNTEHLKLYFRIERYMRCQNYKEAELLFNQLEKIFDEKRLKDICPENRQLFLRIGTILKKALHNMPLDQAIKQYKEALAATLPNYIEIDLTKYPLRYQEIRILNNIAICLYMQGNQKESLRLWSKAVCQYQNKWICKNAYYSAYEIIIENYTSVLANCGNYKKSTEEIYKIIKYLLESGSIERLGRCYYEIVWNREQELIKQNKDITKSKFLQKKLKQSEVIARMIKDRFYIQFLKEHRERLYDFVLI